MRTREELITEARQIAARVSSEGGDNGDVYETLHEHLGEEGLAVGDVEDIIQQVEANLEDGGPIPFAYPKTGRELRDWLNSLTNEQLDFSLVMGGFEEYDIEISYTTSPANTELWIQINAVVEGFDPDDEEDEESVLEG